MHYFPNYTICCKLCYFAAFCSNMISCWKRDPSESLQNDKLSLCTNFGSNQCITFQNLPFAANNTILQNFAATWLFFVKEATLSQFRMPNSPSVPIFEVINALLSKIYYLLQIMLFCSILQQHDQFLKRDPSESLQNDELSMCTNFGSNQCITF